MRAAASRFIALWTQSSEAEGGPLRAHLVGAAIFLVLSAPVVAFGMVEGPQAESAAIIGALPVLLAHWLKGRWAAVLTLAMTLGLAALLTVPAYAEGRVQFVTTLILAAAVGASWRIGWSRVIGKVLLAYLLLTAHAQGAPLPPDGLLWLTLGGLWVLLVFPLIPVPPIPAEPPFHGLSCAVLTAMLVAWLMLAEAIAPLLGFVRPVWIPVTLVVLLTPPLDRVRGKAGYRIVGTFGGIVVAGALGLAGLDGTWLLLATMAIAALSPRFLTIHYGLFVALFTPLVIVLSGAEHLSLEVSESRMAETVIGAGLAAVAAALSTAITVRLERRLSAAGD